jgi:hypothetical protein
MLLPDLPRPAGKAAQILEHVPVNSNRRGGSQQPFDLDFRISALLLAP